MSASDRGDAYAAASPAAPDGPEIRGGIGEMALPVYICLFILQRPGSARQRHVLGGIGQILHYPLLYN